MQILSLVSTKGGSAKTSLATAIAVEVGAVLLDLDPQASACRWRDRREADEPVVTAVAPDRVRSVLDAARAQGVADVVLDSPPRSATAVVEAARVADLVVVPCRPQILDLETIALTQRALALVDPPPRVVIVLVAVPPRGQRALQARSALESRGLRVCPHMLGARAVWGDAGALGLTPVEFDPECRAAGEVRRVVGWLRHVLTQPGLEDGNA